MVLPDLGGWTYTGPLAKALERRRHRVDRRPDRVRRLYWVLCRSLDVEREQRAEASASASWWRSHDPLLATRRGRRPALHRHPHVRPRAARRPTRRASTPRSRRPVRHRDLDAPGRALRPRRASATPRCCCGRTTRRRTVDVFGALSIADLGDLDTTPGNAERTAAQIAEQLEPVIRAGATPITLGGDHSIVLGELRAHAAVHGPVGVVLLDAHADTWEQYYGERYFHGTPFKRALEEGLIDPHRSLLAGMRGSLYAPSDLDEPRGWGFEIVPCDELRTWTPADYAERVRARVGDGPAFLSLRHRRDRPRVRARHGHARGLRPAPARGDRVPARAARACASPATTSSRSRRPTTPTPRHRAAGGQHRLRDAHA